MARRICAVTGASGLLGWHGAVAAKFKHGYEIACDDRAMWTGGGARLAQLVDGAEVVLHCAALNRAADDAVTAENAAITDALVAALDRATSKPRCIVFTNSTHVERDTAYGAMKRQAADRLHAAADRIGATFIDAVLPNVFGECGKPFSNSVVHTFCRQLADGATPRVDGNATIELVHAGAAAEAMFAEVAKGGPSRRFRIAGEAITVPDLLATLSAQLDNYKAGIFPDVARPLDLQLFNTLRSFLLPGHYPIALKLNTDNRGALAECVKSEGGGQVFYSSTKPGITRGNHFHFGKVERFLVLEGEAVIRIRRVLAPGAPTHEFRVSGGTPVAIDMPTLHTHNITNVGDGPVITLFWTHEIFDPARPDTHAEVV